jgi:hypothetical protein
VSAVVAQCQGAVETAHDVFNHDAPVVFCLLSQQGVAINISVDKQVIALLIGNALSDYILNGVNLLVQSFYHKLECTSIGYRNHPYFPCHSYQAIAMLCWRGNSTLLFIILAQFCGVSESTWICHSHESSLLAFAQSYLAI